jgi:tetratricopeptide (TPR) repeat protein
VIVTWHGATEGVTDVGPRIRLIENLVIVLLAVGCVPLVSTAALAQQDDPPTPATDSQATEAQAPAAEAAGETPADEKTAKTDSTDPKPIDPQSFVEYALGLDHMKAGRIDKAIEAFKRAAELDPSSADILRNLALAYLRKDDLAAAEKTFLECVGRNPALGPEAYYRLARLAARQSERDKTETYLKKAIADKEKTGDNRYFALALYSYAQFLDRGGQRKEAAQRYEQLIRWLDATPEAMTRDREVGQLLALRRRLIGRAVQTYLREEMSDRAVALVRDVAGDLFGQPVFSELLIMSLLNQKKTDLALEVGLEMQRRRPTDTAAYRLLARVYEQKGDDDAFVKAFRGFLKVQDDLSVLKLLLGRKLVDIGRTAEGVTLIREVATRAGALAEIGTEALVPATVATLLKHKQTEAALDLALAAQKHWPNQSDSYTMLARVFEELKDDKRFVEVFGKLREARPDTAVIALLLGQKLLEMGQDDAGRKMIEPLMAQDPKTASAARAILLEHCRKSGEPGKALVLFAQVLNDVTAQAEDTPTAQLALHALVEDLGRFIDGVDDVPATIAIGRAALKTIADAGEKKALGPEFVLGMLHESIDRGQAEKHYEAALEAAPKSAYAHERRFSMLVGLDRLTDAIDALKEASVRTKGAYWPDRFMRQLGLLYEFLGRDADAAATYSTSVRLNGDRTSARLGLMRVLLRLGRADEAAYVAEQALDSFPNDDTTYVDVAQYHVYLLRDPDKALSVIDRGLEALPENANLTRVRILMLSRVKRTDEAIGLCDHLAEAGEPMTMMARGLKGDVLVAAKQYDKAELLIRELIAEEPDEPDHLYSLSSLYEQQGKKKKAEKILTDILARFPRHGSANNDLGYAMADRGENLERSERMIRLAVQEAPWSAAALDSLGWVHYKLNRMDRALAYLQRCLRLELHPDPVILDHLGDVLVRLDRTDEARAVYRQAVTEMDSPKRQPGRDDAKVRKALEEKLKAIRKGKRVPVAPLGSGVE